MKCEKCSKEHDGSFGSGRFCSRACANSKPHSKETRIKISKSLGGDGNVNDDNAKCKNCGRKLGNHQPKFCSIKCSGLYVKKQTDKKIENGECQKPERLKEYVKKQDGNKCKECGQLPEWNDKLLVLQLDHIDGNSDNNFPINLRLLCPNCHTQTDTWTSKGYGPNKRKQTARNKFLRRNRKRKL